MPEIIFEHSGWWLLPIIILAVALAGWLYYVGKHFSVSQRRLLALLRFLIFFLLGVLLLSPLYKMTERKEEKPILVWLEDHSSSMLAQHDSSQVKERLSGEAPIKKVLQEKYRLAYFDFSESLMAADDSFSKVAPT
ncbi:MAG: hypothetical protein U5L96_21690 [Owenweeksia sp.]|nr:hypothetical protein [Owenweeksia sp.]